MSIKLSAAGYAAPTHIMHISVEKFVQDVAAATDGQIQVEFFPTASLIGGRDMLQAGRTGVADIVSVATSYYPAELAFSATAGTLPFLWHLGNFDRAASLLKPYLAEELATQNLKPLWTVGTVTQWFFMQPVDLNTPDWSGRKVRTFGANATKTIEILSGTAVSMSADEVPVAVATGTLQGLGTSLGSFHGYDLYRDVPYVVMTNDVPLIPIIAINVDSWNKIPAHLQTTVLQVADQVEKWAADWLREQESAMQATVREKTPHVLELTAEQQRIWQQKLRPLYDEFSKQFGDKAVQFLKELEKIQ